MKSTATAILAAITLACTVTACSGNQKPESTVDTINAVYLPVRTLATLCAASISKPCQDPNVSANVQKAIPLADAAVAEAIKNILASPDQSNASKWSRYAMSAIDILAKALAVYDVKA
jgi:hypothetical protein